MMGILKMFQSNLRGMETSKRARRNVRLLQVSIESKRNGNQPHPAQGMHEMGCFNRI